MNFGIRNLETNEFLSRVNLFTVYPDMALRTTKDHAAWIKSKFDEENEYSVEVYQYQ